MKQETKSRKSEPSVAIVHDWLVGGGAERVVYELHRMFPKAPIYTSYCTDEWRAKMDDKVVTGFLQHFPRLRKYLPPLRAWWFSHLNLKDYDLIISSSGAEAKGVRASVGTLHVAYIHAPTHYYWSRYDDYVKSPGFPTGFNWLAKLGLKLLIGPMRRWDYKAAQRPDYLIANSTYTQSHIKKYYGRESVIIHPPVEIERFQVNSQRSTVNTKRHGFVIAGRQTPYKRVDLAVQVCTSLGLSLTVIGNGPDHEKLVKMAGPTIRFDTNASDQAVAQYLASAEAFIFPGIDDFGIVAVEAMAAGTPVIAYQEGGALDYVVEGKTGLFFDKQTPEALEKVLRHFKFSDYSEPVIKTAVQKFSVQTFHQSFKSFIDTLRSSS